MGTERSRKHLSHTEPPNSNRNKKDYQRKKYFAEKRDAEEDYLNRGAARTGRSRAPRGFFAEEEDPLREDMFRELEIIDLDQEPENPEYEDREPEYQEYENQEPEYLEYEDQEPGYQGYEDQEPGYQEYGDQELEYQEYEDQEIEYREYEDQELEYQEYEDREPEAQESEKPRRTSTIIMILLFLVLVGVSAAAGYQYYQLPWRCVKSEITMEAGNPCPAVADFLNWENETAYIVSGVSEDMSFEHVEDIDVVIRLHHQDIPTVLHVVDTVPPELKTKDKTIMWGEPVELADFLESVSDVTDYEVAYQKEPNVMLAGVQEILLTAEDEGGNVTESAAQLEVLQDVTPPVIEGVHEMTVNVGESVSYKRDVTVTDDYDDEVKLQVDNSQVDIDTPGDYTVVYSAADKYGNVTEIETVIHVIKVVEVTQGGVSVPITEELVYAEADKVLASITNESMSQYEVIRAIYDWCHSKVAYVNGASKENWLEGAYDGIVLRKGDCYTYAMTAKCLLTRAGIVNMDIERVRVGNGMHFWNLVDIGEGWHHFDTCRRSDGATFFYLTDAELMAYSEKHTGREYPNGTHYYDRSLYPEIP